MDSHIGGNQSGLILRHLEGITFPVGNGSNALQALKKCRKSRIGVLCSLHHLQGVHPGFHLIGSAKVTIIHGRPRRVTHYHLNGVSLCYCDGLSPLVARFRGVVGLTLVDPNLKVFVVSLRNYREIPRRDSFAQRHFIVLVGCGEGAAQGSSGNSEAFQGLGGILKDTA